MPRDGRSPVSLELARARYRAGETVVARVRGVTSPAAVALVRVEHRPRANRAVVVADAQLGVLPGSVELTIPPWALPTASGAECALSYVLEARAGGAIARAGVEISAVAQAHLDRNVWWADRFIAHWDARHFHIELNDAVLHGGGRIAGRVHRHGPRGRGRDGDRRALQRVLARVGASRARNPAMATLDAVGGRADARPRSRRHLDAVWLRSARSAAGGGRGAHDRLAL
jgi:hypothetical protein